MADKKEWTRTIVLNRAFDEARGSDLAEPLKSMCAKRDWFPVQKQDPYAAMAELCLREKAQEARKAWGLEPMEQLALVIVEPEDWAEAEALVAAVQKFLPATSIWAVQDETLASWGAAGGGGLNIDRAMGNSARAAASQIGSGSEKNGRAPATISDDSDDGLHSDPRRLTREEIDMLLSPEPEAQGGKG